MRTKHWALLGLSLVSVGAMGAALPSWGAALTPAFVFGVVGVIGTQLVTLYTDKPNKGE